MSKPRIFISSTFYDLRQVRADIDYFIESMGYEAVRNEVGDIPYGQQEALEQYYYKEIDKADILVSIIGGRYGSESATRRDSSQTIHISTFLQLLIEHQLFGEMRCYHKVQIVLSNRICQECSRIE